MTHQFELETSRLLLRSVTPAFIKSIFAEKSEEEIKSYFNTDEKGYLHLESMNENGMEKHRISMFYFLLFDKETDSCIGECGFHTLNKTHSRAELFYNLTDISYRQKGLMTEVVKVVIDFGFEHLNLHRIEALVAIWNTASIKLLERYQFTKEGTMREDYFFEGNYENSECYSLLKQEWEKNCGQK